MTVRKTVLFIFLLLSLPSIASAEIDLIVEADTYAPAPYKGRAEPTAGSLVRLVAIPSDGQSNLTYHWRINNQDLPDTGNSVSFKSPLATSIAVQVTARRGQIIYGQKTEIISLSRPQVLIYENNPLRGRSSIAITDSYVFAGDEVAFSALPYFTPPMTADDSLVGEWLIDGVTLGLNNDWRELEVTKPDIPKEQYEFTLQVLSQDNYMERMSNSFIVLNGI